MTQLSDSDIAAILELHDRWVKEELAGNESQIISFCTDDIRWIPPNAPPLEGKPAINKYIDDNRVDLKDIQVTETKVYGSGSVGYLVSNFSSRYLPQQSSDIQESTGTHVWVVRKDTGVWQVAVVAWSSWEQARNNL